MSAAGAQYDVAVSFAGAERPYVQMVVNELRSAGVTVFYDEDEQVALWGKNLVDEFLEINSKRAFRVVMFVSEEYVARGFPNHERQAALDRQLASRDPYILPVRMDDAQLTGLPKSTAYIDARSLAPGDVAAAVAEHLAQYGRVTPGPPEELSARADQARRVSVSGVLSYRADGHSTLHYMVKNASDYPIESAVVVLDDPGRDGSPFEQTGTGLEMVLGGIAPGQVIDESFTDFPMSEEPFFAELTQLTYLLFVDRWGTAWGVGPGVVKRLSNRPRIC